MLIVVCPNTIVSKLVFDWIAGRDAEIPDGTSHLVPGNLPLLSNVEDDGTWTTRQRTILIDSEQLESGEPLGADFRKAAAREIEAFKQSYRLRNPGADVDKLTDADLLREAMNTIGKKGKLGEHIRCVVSVAMLTEGWDANTVTHILGVRPFRSQLLCEQVVGRGLRRRNYAVNPDTGRFEPEYAEVYGVPFAFIPSDRQIPKPRDPRPAVEVTALPERWDLAIRFPKLDGYRVELPDETLHADFDEDSRMHLDQATVALWVKNQGVIGAAAEVDLDDIRNARTQRIAFAIAKTLIEREEFFAALGGAQRPWLFPQLVDITRQWLDQCVTTEAGVTKGHLLLTQAGARAAEKVFSSIIRYPGSRQPVLMPIIRRFDSSGSTDDVHFITRKVVMDPPPVKSHLNHVVLDGLRGNSWEEAIAQALEDDPRVEVVREERAARVHDPVRARRADPRVRARLPRPPRHRTRRRRAHADHRGLGQPQVSRTDRRQGRHCPQPVVRGRQQLGRVRPLGLRRGPQPRRCRTPAPRRHRQPVRRPAHHRAARPDHEERRMPPRKSKTNAPTPVDAITHADKRANIPPLTPRTSSPRRSNSPSPVRYPRDPTLDPQLVWKGKDALDSEDLVVDAPPIYIQEKIDPRVLIENLRRTAEAPEDEPELTLFDTFDGLRGTRPRRVLPPRGQLVQPHDPRRLPQRHGEPRRAGGLRGKVQMIYIDPPYGIKFGTNWQVSRPQAGRQGRQGRGRGTRGRADQSLPGHMGTGHQLLSHLPSRPPCCRQGTSDRKRSASSSRSATKTSTSSGPLWTRSSAAENFVAQIAFTKTRRPRAPRCIQSAFDYSSGIRPRCGQVKFRPLSERATGRAWKRSITRRYCYRPARPEDDGDEVSGEVEIPTGWRIGHSGRVRSRTLRPGSEVIRTSWDGERSYTPGNHMVEDDPKAGGEDDCAHQAACVALGRTSDGSYASLRTSDDSSRQRLGRHRHGGFTEDQIYVVQTDHEGRRTLHTDVNRPGRP